MRGEASIGMLIGVAMAVIMGVMIIPIITGTIAEMDTELEEAEATVAPETAVVPGASAPTETDTGVEAYSNPGWLTSIQILAGLSALVLAAFQVYRKVFKPRSTRESTEVLIGTRPKAKITIFGIKIR